MDTNCIYMDKTCIWLNKVLAWVDRCGAPGIPYIGKAPYGYRNQPAPHLEIACLLDKGVKDLSIGDLTVSIPPFHVAIHSVHHGNFTPAMQQFYAWCVFLDVSGEDMFAELTDEPLFCSAPLPSNDEVYAAYERLGGLCVRFGANPLAYDAPGASYDAVRAEAISPSAPLRVKAALLDLLALLLDSVSSGDEGARHPQAIQRAVEYMSLHYRDPALSLADVAHAANLSQDHFGRLFRKHMNKTPMHYLKHMRVNQSRYLLDHSELLIEEIAFNVGFSDPLHFSRVFRAITGMNPRAWRNRD